jgi:RNA polymerase sigma-70 factor (ECF subfamily)
VTIPLTFDLGAKASEIPVTAEDHELITGLQQGIEICYEHLISRFQQPVYNLAYRLLNDPGDACDVTQEVFLKVFRNVGQFRGQSTLRTWIYRIAVNESHNRRRWLFRHRHNEIGLEEEFDNSETRERAIPDSGRSPFDRAFDHEKRSLIEEALTRINPCFREAVVLRDVEDFSYEEIADILQISMGTVKSRIMRGREALRCELTARLSPEFCLRECL